MMSTLVFGQGKYGADSAECIKYLSFYQQYEKQGDLDAAAPSWRNAIKYCPPTASQNMLLDGMKIMRKEISKYRSNPIRKKELVDTLMMLHKMRIETYPKYIVTATNNMAVDMLNYAEPGSEQDVFNALGEALDIAKSKASTSVAVQYMNYAIQLYKAGRMMDQDVFDAFDKSVGTLEMIKAAKPSKMVDDAIADVETMFANSGVASCDNLIALFQPRYDAAPDNQELLSNIAKLFHATGCTDSDLFRNAVEGLYKLNPSATSAHLLFQLYSALPDGGDKAVKYMNEAIAFEDSDAETDAEYSFELANYLFSKLDRKVDAIAAAKQAASLSQTWAGKSYFLIGTIWSVVKCQGNPIEERASFWAATDYMVKAKNADSSLAAEADAQISTYRKYYPLQADAFMYDMVDGDRYEISCNGMREVTTVRTQK
ncbi:MAG TPA: hypothetical protein IAC04_03130 [Candidatus Coprenecus stercoravium]|uniref:Uncharacterized protein n=1 Tax=Candidatus Coprenecus stercoravium TaxID=2840735 RepID=A0A9D2GR74_9BACT|nr:hypothetical protein [Candidatus Coprenecus stercoravium]